MLDLIPIQHRVKMAMLVFYLKDYILLQHTYKVYKNK